MRLLIVSGISGAGKSIVLNALEDLGFHCIDNLPAPLLPALARELSEGSHRHVDAAAVGIDARNLSGELNHFPEILAQLRALDMEPQIIFLDADDHTLITRFSETRRRHPLTGEDIPLSEAIRLERQLLEPISSHADLRIDTTHTHVHQLRESVRERIEATPSQRLSLLFQSFGFKNGIPVDADFVFDVRCLPNPHWDPQLRPLTGRDEPVRQFLGQQPQVESMLSDIKGLLEKWVPDFERENRSYMTIAIGCTGGQHRSVYFVEALASHFRAFQGKVLTRHRELT